MKILFITPSYFPLRGGTEQVIFEFSSLLKDIHEITILTRRITKDMKPHEVINSVEIYRSKLTHIKGLRLLLDSIFLFFLALKLHKRKKFDLIHMFHIFEVGGGTLLFKKFKKLPQIITLMGWDTYSPVRKIPKHYFKYIEMVLNSADIVTAPSNSLSQIAAKQGCRKKVEIIPHGSEMLANTKGLMKNDITYNSRFKGKKIILSVQRLKRVKGLEYLISAIPEIVGIEKNTCFVIAGKGDEENNLKNLVKKLNMKEYVYFPGFVNHDLLPSYYSIADLFVLPSLYETFGLVYIDALSFGVPVVTTENSGSLDIIDEHKGILIPPKDSKKLAGAVIKALNTKWNPRLIKKGLEKYLWKNIIVQYQMLYNKVTHKHGISSQ